ncbi:MAG: hypothetical protein HKO82_12420, partial [Acidimicrobiia bacterium]|nr:hypothetical protein [Acidimicrobiia bacterium]
MNGSMNFEVVTDRGAAMLEHLTVLSDPVRCRALAVLEQDELTVSE